MSLFANPFIRNYAHTSRFLKGFNSDKSFNVKYDYMDIIRLNNAFTIQTKYPSSSLIRYTFHSNLANSIQNKTNKSAHNNNNNKRTNRFTDRQILIDLFVCAMRVHCNMFIKFIYNL